MEDQKHGDHVGYENFSKQSEARKLEAHKRRSSDLQRLDSFPKTGLVRLADILRPGVIPVSRSTWYQGIKDKKYPPAEKKPDRQRTSMWRAEHINQLIHTGQWREGPSDGDSES